jgi:hypothetical protein
MKALSIREPYIYDIALGVKTEEYRTWVTPHRGPVLLCASSYKVPKIGKYFITGHAIAIVDITSIEKRYDFNGVYYAWKLDNVRLVKPFPVKGKLHLFNVDDSLIEPLNIPIDDWPYWLIDHGYCEPWPDDMLARFDAGEFDEYWL